MEVLHSLALELLDVRADVLSALRRLLHLVLERVDVLVVLTQRVANGVLPKHVTSHYTMTLHVT